MILPNKGWSITLRRRIDDEFENEINSFVSEEDINLEDKYEKVFDLIKRQILIMEEWEAEAKDYKNKNAK